MSRILCGIAGVQVAQENDGRVHFVAGAQIDADGANGQHGEEAAYMVGNMGSEHLANGGMTIYKKEPQGSVQRYPDGTVIFAADWGKDIVLWQDGRPMVLPSGIIPSRTAYQFRDKKSIDPTAYVDAETVPYMVVSPTIREKAKGIVLGCKARMTNTTTGQSVNAVLADIGPRNKIGELSIAAARAIGIPHSPRTGGTDEKVIRYEFWPGVPALVDGVIYDLLPA